MKKILFFISLIFGIFVYTQDVTNNIYNRPEFPGGENAFREEFMRMVHGYVDVRVYAVNGLFTFNISIDETGKMKLLDVIPKVRNSEDFQKDMEFAMKRIKKKWKPAIQNGIPIKSKYILKINFTTDHADHGD